MPQMQPSSTVDNYYSQTNSSLKIIYLNYAKRYKQPRKPTVSLLKWPDLLGVDKLADLLTVNCKFINIDTISNAKHTFLII